MPANVKQKDIPNLWRKFGKDSTLPEAPPTITHRCQDVVDQPSTSFKLAVDSEQELFGGPSSQVGQDLQSSEHGRSSLRDTNGPSLGSTVKSCSRVEDSYAKFENAGGLNPNNSLSDDPSTPHSDTPINDTALECGESIRILKASYSGSNEHAGNDRPHFRNTLPAPGSTSPIQYSDDPLRSQDHYFSPSRLTAVSDHQSQDSHTGDAINGGIQSAKETSHPSVDLQSSLLENCSSSSDSTHLMSAIHQNFVNCLGSEEVEGAERLLIPKSTVTTDPPVKEHPNHLEGDSCENELHTQLESPPLYCPILVAPPENLRGSLHVDTRHCDASGQTASSSTTSNLECSGVNAGTFPFSQTSGSIVPKVDALAFSPLTAHSSTSNMPVGVSDIIANQSVRPCLEGFMDRRFKQIDDSSGFPDVNSVLDKYKINRKPGWWKSLLSSEARGHLEPQRSHVEQDAAVHSRVAPEPSYASSLRPAGLGQSIPGEISLHDDHIPKGPTGPGGSCRETKIGSSLSCEALPIDSQHSLNQPSYTRAAHKNKYIDKETERIARIMSHNQEDQ